MKTVFLMGGLGNFMFQVAFLEYLRINGIPVFINEHMFRSPHSGTDYFQNIFINWASLIQPQISSTVLREHLGHPKDWISILKTFYGNVKVEGYFQDPIYITKSFLHKLRLPTDSLNRHPNIGNTVFLHIRGGDYVNHPVHDVKLEGYYRRAIQSFPVGTQFSLFTNDKPYALSQSFLNDILYKTIEESEVDSLYLMSQCKGGICANSSFSWWGAYLNPDRQITLPSKWFNDPSFYKNGYYFKQATIIQV
jgi:hypothetical protein